MDREKRVLAHRHPVASEFAAVRTSKRKPPTALRVESCLSSSTILGIVRDPHSPPPGVSILKAALASAKNEHFPGDSFFPATYQNTLTRDARHSSRQPVRSTLAPIRQHSHRHRRQHVNLMRSPLASRRAHKP